MNNPFASSAQTRYPDISASPDPQYTSWLQQPNASFQQPQQQQQQPDQQAMLQSQLYTGFNQQPVSPVQSPPFQPSSYFGQQLQAATTGQFGPGYAYLQGTATSPTQSYNPVQQQLSNPSYVAQFDPYASIGQGWDGSGQQPPQQPVGATGAAQTTTSGYVNGSQHPRDYIRTHKQEIESWDNYAWKQLLNSFEGLKEAWLTRKKELEGRVAQLQMQLQYGGGGYYAPQIQQETGRLQSLIKEAEANSDTVVASSFQVEEVFSSYRQSDDAASKRRVREASNAALQALPDWPPQQY